MVNTLPSSIRHVFDSHQGLHEILTSRRGFTVSADNLLNDSENSVVELKNHEVNEQVMLINQLDEDEKVTG